MVSRTHVDWLILTAGLGEAKSKTNFARKIRIFYKRQFPVYEYGLRPQEVEEVFPYVQALFLYSNFDKKAYVRRNGRHRNYL